MRILDCESVESTYLSLESILSLSKAELETIFSSLNMDQFYQQNPNYHGSGDELLFAIVNNGPSKTINFERTCWFHLTRSKQPHTFDRGILPLNLQINAIWDFLLSLLDDSISEREWKLFCEELNHSDYHYARLYREKINRAQHWGPYAGLVRDMAFRAEEAGNHNYLRTPEIIEDICLCFANTYQIDLLSRFQERTRPCIVKFVTDDCNQGCIMAALYYLYKVFHDDQLNWYCNRSFDNKGKPLEAGQILKVEFIE